MDILNLDISKACQDTDVPSKIIHSSFNTSKIAID